MATAPRTEAGRELLIRVKAFVYDSRVWDKPASVRDYTNAILAIEAEAASPVAATAPLWDELIMDALASDGPIRDSDVKEAVARWRPKIEGAASPAALDVERLRELLNSLGIVGPNIRHAEWIEAHHMVEPWPGPGWCVCGRSLPCEAAAVGELLR